jgi:hypothetical protein
VEVLRQWTRKEGHDAKEHQEGIQPGHLGYMVDAAPVRVASRAGSAV